MEEKRCGPVEPTRTTVVIRQDAGMLTTRFATAMGVPERSYRRWQAVARRGRAVEGSCPATSPREGAGHSGSARAGASGVGHRKW